MILKGKDLGLTMDPTLSFDEHIKQVVSSSMKKLHQINRIKHLLMPHILEMIIQSCVFPSYFIALLYGQPQVI